MVGAGHVLAIWCLALLSGCFAQIPISVFKQLSEFEGSNEEFIENFIRRGADPNNSTHLPDGYFDEDGNPTSAAREYFGEVLAGAGVCKPKLQDCSIVENSTDPNVLTWPLCTPIKRCGGCCGNSLECVPAQSRYVKRQVMLARYNSQNGKFELPRKVEVSLIEHTQCVCACRTRAQDCSSLHDYIAADCKCRCKNHNEAYECGAHQRWDSSKCMCTCVKVKICEEGLVFNHDTCSCVLPTRGRSSVSETGSRRIPETHENMAEDTCACPRGYRRIMGTAGCGCVFDIFGRK